MNLINSNPFMLAPMAEITTPALRRTIREFSSNVIIFSEMLSAAALVSGAMGNRALLTKYEFDDPFVYQIIGNSDKVMSEACRMLSDIGCYSIDINMGCSAPKVLKKGMGAKLLTDIANTRKIVRACRKASGTKLSVKLRSGFEENNEKYLIAFVKMLEDEGVDFISLHPRFAKLSFSRKADWKLVKIVKENIKIPVIGNGDITDPGMALKRMEEFGCDGIMIGREAVKSPWIFKACESMRDRREYKIILNLEEIFHNTLNYIGDYLPETLHKSRGRRFCFYYCKNFKFAHEFFKQIHRVETLDEMKNTVTAFFERNPEEKRKRRYYNPERTSNN